MDSVYAEGCSSLELCGSDTQFSFFLDLIGTRDQGTAGAEPLHRVCTLMRKMKARSFIRERLVPDEEIRDEFEALARRLNQPLDPVAERITFFSTVPASRHWTDFTDSDLLGYVVRITAALPAREKLGNLYDPPTPAEFPTWRVHYILEAVLRPIGVTNYYTHTHRQFRTTIGVREGENAEFTIPGSFFCQGNRLTHVCAHSALRMCVNNSVFTRDGKLTNERINRRLGYDHRKRIIPSDGLTQEEMSAVAEEFFGDRYRGEVFDFKRQVEVKGRKSQHVDYLAGLYPLIESGCPIILGLEMPDTSGSSQGHVVTVLGHTLNSDRWTPQARVLYGREPLARYISTHAWTDHLIVSDDNHGIYSTLPVETPRTDDFRAVYSLAMVPKEVGFPGFVAEECAALKATETLRGLAQVDPDRVASSNWLRVLLQRVDSKELVCRTMLIRDRGLYLRSMLGSENVRGMRDHSGVSLDERDAAVLQRVLPDMFWLTELTVPDLYIGNRAKLGDVITSAAGRTKPSADLSEVLFMWVPGASWTWSEEGAGANAAPWSFTNWVDLFVLDEATCESW